MGHKRHQYSFNSVITQVVMLKKRESVTFLEPPNEDMAQVRFKPYLKADSCQR